MNGKPLKIKMLIMRIVTDVLLFFALLLYFCYFHHVRTMIGTVNAPEVVPVETIIAKPTSTPTNTPTDAPTDTPTDTPTCTPTNTPTAIITDVPLITVTPGEIIPASPTPSPTPSPKPSPTVTPTFTPTPIASPVPGVDENGVPYDFSGDFGHKFGNMFLGDNRVVVDDTSYRSHDVYIKMSKFDGNYSQKASKYGSRQESVHTVWYAFDVYIRNIENLFTNYKHDTVPFKTLYADTSIGKAIAAISGDLYYDYDSAKPVVVRNGKVIRKADYITSDICVLYWDGTMEIETNETYNWDRIKKRAPYQIWSFGPSLLDENGNPKLNAQSDVWIKNPRSVIGYVEPGHYVLITILGNRINGQKAENGLGANLEATAKIAAEYGCKAAYNLDGGASVYAGFRGEQLFSIYIGSSGRLREISDIICIGELLTGGTQ